LTIIEPLGPLYDAGFGLSFAATLGILLFQKPIGIIAKKWNIPKLIADILALTLGASFGSFPMLLFHFGSFSLTGIIANILIAVLLSWILFSSVLYGVLSLISTTLAIYFGYLVYIPTSWALRVTEWFGGFTPVIFEKSIALTLALFLLGFYSFLFLRLD
jgi:competence protein ComEC